MEVFNENIENEVYPVGQVQIVNFPYKQDRRYSLESEIPDKKVHTGSVQNFRLARHFMDYVSFQEGENPLLNNKLRDITKEEQDELDSLSDEDKTRRIRQIIRRRYPAIIKLPPGVLYSPSLSVVLESFDKIKFIHQAKIDLTAIYSDYIPSGRIVRAREALQAINHLNEQNSQDLEEYDDPLPGPSRNSSCVDVETPKGQKRSFESIVSAPERAGALENGKRLSGVSRRLDFDEFPQGTQSSKVLFTFFDEDFMGFSRDKKAADGGVVTPITSSLTRSVQVHANNQDMDVVNSVKVGPQFFGLGRCQIDLYKKNNFYQGHCVNFSLREATKLIQAIIRSYYKGAEMTAEYHYNNEVTNAAAMEEEGSSEDASLALDEATKIYNARMKCIKVARRKFEEGL